MIYNAVLTGPRRVTTCEVSCHTADEAEVTALMKRDGWSLSRREPQDFGAQHFVDLHWSRDAERLDTENARIWFLLKNTKAA